MAATALLLTAASSVGFLGWWDDYCDDMSVGLARRVAGEVVVPSDNATYESAVHQYAYSSDPTRMRPSGVVFPANDRDVKRAVRYAGICDYRVTVRSGGHQYMGLSSCDSTVHKCMQIDMSHYKNMSIDGTTVTIGVGVSLAEMYTTLAQHGLFLGAGECGTVNVGGHVQTGGYGLLARSFGALADQVTSFTIILAGGRKKLIPRPGSAGSTKRKDDLFWAVLGGGAGSWGVVTEYTLEAHRDADYSESTYWNCMVPYSRTVFEDMAGAFEAVSGAAGWDANHQEALWMTTVKRSPFDTDFIHIEAAWAGLDGVAFDDSSYQTFVQAVNGRGLCTAFPANLSTVLTQFTTFYGEREFPFPYEKRNRITRATSMGPTFKGTLADQMEAVMQIPGLFFFSQLVTIGGKMLDMQGGDIALPLRDARVNVDIAVFYSEGMNPAAKALTTQYQDAAWTALAQLPSFADDLRYVWANWGNVNIEEVNDKYYESDTYARLREIKKDVDLLNTFRTTFTIPPEDCEWDDIFDG